MTVHLNRVAHNVTGVPGTGDLLLDSVPDGFLNIVTAGATDGSQHEFVVETADGLIFEIFLGTYRVSGHKLERTTVRITSNGGTGKLDLPANCVVYSNVSSESIDTDTAASAAAAAASAAAALASQTAAAASATAAGISEANAAADAAVASAAAAAAATSESNAGSSATAAASSAAAAASSETDAQTAQTAAETAQTAAETARTGAETAETNASASATAAAGSATSASASATAASSSETDAQTAQTAAETAQAAAEAAQAAAEATVPLTTKGDIYGYDTQAKRIPVGTNGHVLTADSTEALGVKWAASTGGLANVVEDATPQLGGSLDVNGNKIVSTSDGDIDIEPDGTGNVLLGNFTFDADQTVGAGQDNYVLTYDNAAGIIALEAAAAAGLSDVVDDTTPQLGGNLDVNGNSIVSTSNGDITLDPDGTGDVILGNLVIDGDQAAGASQDGHVLTFDNATGLVALAAAAAGGSGANNISVSVFTTTGAGTWNKPTGFLSGVVIGTGAGGGGEEEGSADRAVGGSAGGTFFHFINDADVASTEAVNVGAGGDKGDNGGDTTFDTIAATVTAGGGLGGNNSSSGGVMSGVLGGTCTNADFSIPGGASSPIDTGSGSEIRGSVGGTSFWGGMGQGNGGTSHTDGAYGAGGFGASDDALGVASGVGQNGVLIVIEFNSV